MNITDIDDKVSCFCYEVVRADDKIILRARESHLLAEAVTANTSLRPELVSTAKTAFTKFVEKKLVKCLPSPVNSAADADGLAQFDAILAKDQADPEWAKSAREKEEKFGMYLTSLTRASSAIRTAEERAGSGDAGVEGVKELVEGAADVLGPHLGETVSGYRLASVQAHV